MYNSGMSVISASDARRTLPAQLDLVEAGEEVSITRHGRVVAVLVSPDALRARRNSETWAQADAIRSLLDDARERPLVRAPMSATRVETLVSEARASRQDR